MRFRVKYPTGAEQDVDLEGPAVFGRDAACDIVLKDPRCSRRHAAIELTNGGTVIRDLESANGLFLNGRKTTSAPLRVGDVIRIGEINITVVPGETRGTVAMGADEVAAMAAAIAQTEAAGATAALPAVAPTPTVNARATSAPSPPVAAPPPVVAPPPPAVTPPSPPAAPALPSVPPVSSAAPVPEPAPPAPAPSPAEPVGRRLTGPITRPLTVTLLALLWMLGGLLYPGAAVALVLAGAVHGGMAVGLVTMGVVLGALAFLTGYGLFRLAIWGRFLQMGFAMLGLFGPFVIPAAAILMYMLREDITILFSGRRDRKDLSAHQAQVLSEGRPEAGFASLIAGSIVLSAAALGVFVYVARHNAAAEGTLANEMGAIEQMRTVVTAEQAFRTGTCGAGYADWQGLTLPQSEPGVSGGTAPFLKAERAPTEAWGYQFELAAVDLLPPTSGCPSRVFTSYTYSARPTSGQGRFFRTGPDRVIHAAEGRPATPDDPPVHY